MANLSHITRAACREIERIPFGMHACHFYGNRDQLVAALVPYAVAGRRGNERCLWITPPPFAAALQRGPVALELTPAEFIAKEIAASMHAMGRDAAVRRAFGPRPFAPPQQQQWAFLSS